LAGVIDTEDRVAGVTARKVLPDTFPEAAATVTFPAATAVASPLLLTVATPALDVPQVTWAVMSRLVPSEYLPEAANCLVAPSGMLGLAGVTDMEDSVPAVTVRLVFPEIRFEVAVMVVVPAATVAARPLLLTVATAELDDLQVTLLVMLWVVPSEYEPRAVN